MNLKQLAEARIVIDDDICSGKARIKGTRITVSEILLCLAEGLSHQEILRNFRSIQAQDIQAAIAYAYCLIDKTKLNIRSSFGESKALIAGEADKSLATLNEEDINSKFSRILEEQAAIQEEITKEKVAQIQSKKIQKSKAPTHPKQEAPKERAYDLLIDISGDKSIKIFSDIDALEQPLNMDYESYVFEKRSDQKLWLTYSVRDGIEIDQAMKRNLLVTYKGIDGRIKESIFEGYLTTDRQHKIFIERDPETGSFGRAL